jgi:phenylpropionate dioxygenase-like ring-hydroxylating dioxygenase large terminal subunit
MQHELQVSILKELMRQLDAGQNIDAGVMFKNPTSVYTCSDLAQREWETLFLDHPQLIGLSADLPEPGSFLAIDDFGVPVLATRDKSGRFRAFLNACRHRGVRVANEERGKARHFVCPFHNWSYATDGALVGIPQPGHFGEVDKSCRGLLELPAEEKYGLLFVHPKIGGHLDVDALLGDLAPEIAGWDFGGRMVYRAETLIEKRLNWKLANDTFGETYHFEKLHKNTLGQVFYGDVLGYESFGRNHRFIIASRQIDRLRELPESEWQLTEGTSPLYFLFPNIQFSFGTDVVSLIKIYPKGNDPSHSVTRVAHYFSKEAIAREEQARKDPKVHLVEAHNAYDRDVAEGLEVIFGLSALTEVFDSTIEQEDYLMGETTQRSAEDGQLDHVIFGRNEPALHHYHRHYREALGMPPLEEFKERSSVD